MVKDKDSVGFSRDKSKNKVKILNSRYTLLILLNIYHGYRPSQIANRIGISAQLINYYTDNLIDLKLIEKVGDRQPDDINAWLRAMLYKPEYRSFAVSS